MPPVPTCPRRLAGLATAFGLAALIGCSKGGGGDPPTPPIQPPPPTVEPTTVEADGNGFSVRLVGAEFGRFASPELDGNAAAITTEDLGNGWAHVRARWNLAAPVAQDDLQLRLELGFDADWHWLPHLAPIESYVVGEHVFRSPALIAAAGTQVLALVPDLDLIDADYGARLYLDLDAPADALMLGMARQVRPIEVLFQKAPGMTLAAGPVELGFFVRAMDGQEFSDAPFRPVHRFLWERYGQPRFAAGAPASVALDDYVSQTYDWAFDTWEDRVWQEFDLGGTAVGAPLHIVDATWSPHSTVPWRPRGRPGLWNQAWFCALRSAMGLRQWAVRQGSVDLLRRAELTEALTLAAPVDQGLFPSVFLADLPTQPGPGPELVIDWTTGQWTGSDRSPAERGITRDWYHLADACWTGLWMLRWDREAAPSIGLRDRATGLGERLLQLQRQDGHWPAWLDPTTQQPATVLEDSVESAAVAWFLLELAKTTGRQDFRDAGLRGIDAALVPAIDGRWEDFETYWSNQSLGRDTFVGLRVPRNNIYKQNTFGMIWVAGACLEAFAQLGEQRYLDAGLRVVDELCMWQQVWRPPFIHVPALGGFGVMNADAEWNDARQSLCAELFLDYAAVTGDQHLWERGVAALRISFAMMYTPLNPEAEQQWQLRHPFLGPLDRGFTMENYAHYEIPAPDGSGMGDFAIYDWGAGAAAQSWNRIHARMGNVYVDLDRVEAVAIDALDVVLDSGTLTITDRAGTPRQVRVVFSDGTSTEVFVDGSSSVPVPAN